MSILRPFYSISLAGQSHHWRRIDLDTAKAQADRRCAKTGEPVFVFRRGIRKADLVYRVEVIEKRTS